LGNRELSALNSRCKSFFASREIFSHARVVMVTRAFAMYRRAVFLCSAVRRRGRHCLAVSSPHLWRLRAVWPPCRRAAQKALRRRDYYLVSPSAPGRRGH
jgi:hypothetical protein